MKSLSSDVIALLTMLTWIDLNHYRLQLLMHSIYWWYATNEGSKTFIIIIDSCCSAAHLCEKCEKSERGWSTQIGNSISVSTSLRMSGPILWSNIGSFMNCQFNFVFAVSSFLFVCVSVMRSTPLVVCLHSRVEKTNIRIDDLKILGSVLNGRREKFTGSSANTR